uniref:Dual specificity phosphatase 23 n=1 Tax=Sarcophilus harrisii TaxID=9305 RepID=A0A7N4P4H8_SARHA
MGSQPPNFSWVLPGRLAGLALPRIPAHYQFLWAQGVRHLVSLTERGPPYSDTCPGLRVHRIRVPDFCPPTPEQIDRFVRIVDEANARGEGRRGYICTMASCCVSAHRCSLLSQVPFLGLSWNIHSSAQFLGCGGPLRPGLREDRHHAGLLPGKEERPVRETSCGRDPAASTRFHRDPGARESSLPILPTKQIRKMWYLSFPPSHMMHGFEKLKPAGSSCGRAE